MFAARCRSRSSPPSSVSPPTRSSRTAGRSAKLSLAALERRAHTAPGRSSPSLPSPRPGRRGQDDDRDRPRRCARANRRTAALGAPRALARPGVRDQGRRHRRRARAGRRRPTRSTSTSRATSTRSGRRTTCSLPCSRLACFAREPAPARPAHDHLAALPRHGRPRAAQDRRRARRPHERQPPRDGLRHHRRLGGDGDHGVSSSSTTCAGGSARSRRQRPDGAPRDRRGARRSRLDGRAARARAEAEPRADGRGHARPSSTAAPSPTSPTATTRCSRTRLGLQLADCVVTESGFGADMGFEKLVDIVCRTAGSRRARSSSSRRCRRSSTTAAT